MIESKTLRPGNFILVNDEVKQVLAVAFDEIWDSNGQQHNCTTAEPIALSKELLVNMKVQQNRDIPPFYFDYFETNGTVEFVLFGEKSDYSVCQFKHLHELQNFYYYLTKCELSFHNEYIYPTDLDLSEIASKLFDDKPDLLEVMKDFQRKM